MNVLLEIFILIRNPALKKNMQIDIGHVYNEQGIACLEQADLDKAELFFKKALEMYRHVCEYSYAETIINLAYVYSDKGDFESAIRELNQSLDYFNSLFKMDDPVEKQQDCRLRIAKCHFALGFVNHAKNDLPESIHSYKRALITYEKMNEVAPGIKTKLEIAKTYAMIRNLYALLNMPEETQEYNNKLGIFMVEDEEVFHYLFEHDPQFKEMIIKKVESKK